jgi:hypothetical protein
VGLVIGILVLYAIFSFAMVWLCFPSVLCRRFLSCSDLQTFDLDSLDPYRSGRVAVLPLRLCSRSRISDNHLRDVNQVLVALKVGRADTVGSFAGPSTTAGY